MRLGADSGLFKSHALSNCHVFVACVRACVRACVLVCERECARECVCACMCVRVCVFDTFIAHVHGIRTHEEGTYTKKARTRRRQAHEGGKHTDLTLGLDVIHVRLGRRACPPRAHVLEACFTTRASALL